MHVVVWETDADGRTFGPFPDADEADGWLFTLGTLVDGDRTRAQAAMVCPAYDLRSTTTPTKAAARPVKLTQHGTDSDERAFGFVLRMLRADGERLGIVGLFDTRSAAVAWWTVQKESIDTEKMTEAQVLPLVPVPVTITDMACSDDIHP